MKPNTLVKIISGANTGVDTGALMAAEVLGLKTGGWACKGWKDETGTGNREWMEELGLKECKVEGYPARTEANVRDSDATLIISHEQKLTGGSYMTQCVCESMDKNYRLTQVLKTGKTGKKGGEVVVVVDSSLSLVQWLNMIECRTLNIAGPRESKCPGIGQWVMGWLIKELS